MYKAKSRITTISSAEVNRNFRDQVLSVWVFGERSTEKHDLKLDCRLRGLALEMATPQGHAESTN